MIDFAPLLADPVLARALGAALSVVLLTGAWQKWREPEIFRAALENYRLLPDGLLAPISRLLPLWEAGAGFLLLLPATRAAGGMLAAALLCVVSAAVVVNLLRGYGDIDCGCGGIGSSMGEQPLSWALAMRNGILLAALPVASSEGLPRAMVSLDYLTVACGTLALVGLYASANQLMANHPRLHALRNS